MNSYIKCFIHNTNTGERQIYEKPTYTNINGLWGYVAVSQGMAYFFYEQDGRVSCDPLTNCIVSYEITTN